MTAKEGIKIGKAFETGVKEAFEKEPQICTEIKTITRNTEYIIRERTIRQVLKIIDQEIKDAKNDGDNKYLPSIWLNNVKGKVQDLLKGDE